MTRSQEQTEFSFSFFSFGGGIYFYKNVLDNEFALFTIVIVPSHKVRLNHSLLT